MDESGQAGFVETPAKTNRLGIAGFVVSIFGLLTCGCVAPIGLLLSFIAVFWKPRGFAIAGIVISTVAILVGSILVFSLVSAGLSFGPAFQDGVGVQQAIAEYRIKHDGKTPASFGELGGKYANGLLDQWGHPYKYDLWKDGFRVELRSAGSDGVEDTSDDVFVRIDGTRVFAFVGRPPMFVR